MAWYNLFMQNFSIGTQIDKELSDFRTKKVRMASLQHNDNLRYLKKEPEGYYFNQADTVTMIDLYWNSKFETGRIDKQGQRKIFMNVGKFRTEVSAKQVDIDVKDFKFLPDDYADPWTAYFLQKDFKEWTKDTYFGELVNQCVDNFPKYGSIVLKKVGKEIKFVPLQNLYNEQTADSLDTASYVIEEHPAMRLWEVNDMPNWNRDGLEMRFDETMDVYERYGHVPVSWLKKANDETPAKGDDDIYVDALVICGKTKNSKNTKQGWHIFFADEISKRPYREAHWNKQHGRWLGCGTMEDLIENQQAKNIIINLVKRSLQWSSKRIGQTANSDVAAKNLARDVQDGEILEVGANGTITEVNLSSKTNADFSAFLGEWEKNADQKAFTYEVATGESLPSGTPFRLGVILSNAVNSFFGLKREKLGLFLKRAVGDFLVPQFLKDMSDEERVITMFSDEPGFEALKQAAMDHVRSEAARLTMLSGEPVDASIIEEVAQPFEEVKTLFFKLPANYYKEAKFKFDFTVTGEEVDVQAKIETLKTLYQIMAQQGDPRAEKVLERISALSGENLATFGPKPPPATPAMIPGATGANPNVRQAQPATA